MYVVSGDGAEQRALRPRRRRGHGLDQPAAAAAAAGRVVQRAAQPGRRAPHRPGGRRGRSGHAVEADEHARERQPGHRDRQRRDGVSRDSYRERRCGDGRRAGRLRRSWLRPSSACSPTTTAGRARGPTPGVCRGPPGPGRHSRWRTLPASDMTFVRIAEQWRTATIRLRGYEGERGERVGGVSSDVALPTVAQADGRSCGQSVQQRPPRVTLARPTRPAPRSASVAIIGSGDRPRTLGAARGRPLHVVIARARRARSVARAYGPARARLREELSEAADEFVLAFAPEDATTPWSRPGGSSTRTWSFRVMPESMGCVYPLLQTAGLGGGPRRPRPRAARGTRSRAPGSALLDVVVAAVTLGPAACRSCCWSPC